MIDFFDNVYHYVDRLSSFHHQGACSMKSGTSLSEAIEKNNGPVQQDFWFEPSVLLAFKEIRRMFCHAPHSVELKDGSIVPVTPRTITGAIAKLTNHPMKFGVTLRVTRNTQVSREDHLMISGHHVIIWGQYAAFGPQLIHMNDPVLSFYQGGMNGAFFHATYTTHEHEVIDALCKVLGDSRRTWLAQQSREKRSGQDTPVVVSRTSVLHDPSAYDPAEVFL